MPEQSAASALPEPRARRRRRSSLPRTAVRLGLGAFLTWAGINHLTVARDDYASQLPEFVTMDPDSVVLLSGLTEVTLGGALVLLRRRRIAIGGLVAVFFVVVFPGNMAQWLHRRDGFGLDTDTKRFARLFLQPVLIALTLWATHPPRPRR